MLCLGPGRIEIQWHLVRGNNDVLWVTGREGLQIGMDCGDGVFDRRRGIPGQVRAHYEVGYCWV